MGYDMYTLIPVNGKNVCLIDKQNQSFYSNSNVDIIRVHMGECAEETLRIFLKSAGVGEILNISPLLPLSLKPDEVSAMMKNISDSFRKEDQRDEDQLYTDLLYRERIEKELMLFHPLVMEYGLEIR